MEKGELKLMEWKEMEGMGGYCPWENDDNGNGMG
jgi:hypothetical protein